MGKKVTKLAILPAALFLSVVTVGGADTLHRLKGGETLYSLSRRYGVSVDQLLSANNIDDPSSLSVGMDLLIPGGADSGIPTDSTVPADYEYTVKKGDTYYSIARSHDMVVDDLLSLNSRGAERVLRIGETLIVSSQAAAGPEDPKPVPSPGTWSPGSADTEVVTRVPWWPVAGMKSPLDGKLVGVSIAADPRSYVHAVAEGNVVWTGPYRGFGHVVLVDSDGYIYLYGGNEDLFVNVGQSVTAGSRIGRLGASGPGGERRDMIFSVFREGIPVSPDEAPRG